MGKSAETRDRGTHNQRSTLGSFGAAHTRNDDEKHGKKMTPIIAV